MVAPSEVSDRKLAQVREIVTGIFSGRPAFFEELSENNIRIIIFKPNAAGEGAVQLPELWGLQQDALGLAFQTATGGVAVATEVDRNCYTLIHELAHTIHYALLDQPDGLEFNERLRALYTDALDAGLWQGSYAAWNVREFWAETVTFWFHEFVRSPSEARGMKLEDYNPEIAKLIEETFGKEAYVPAYCKP